VSTAALVNELAEAADLRALSRVVGRHGRLDSRLVCFLHGLGCLLLGGAERAGGVRVRVL
jgi:hypothetical protein